MSESVSAPCRRLAPTMFPADQVAGWVAQAGPAEAPAAAEPDAAATEWVVAYTDPKRETDVARALRRRSFAAYVPAMTVTRQRKDVSHPLLPRYVFLGLHRGLTLYDLRETPGLDSVVRVGGQPAQVDPALVVGLYLQERDGVYDFTLSRQRERAKRAREAWRAAKMAALAVGAAVRIVAGPFRGFGGTVLNTLPPDRLRLGMKLLGREFQVPVRLDDIEVVVIAK